MWPDEQAAAATVLSLLCLVGLEENQSSTLNSRILSSFFSSDLELAVPSDLGSAICLLSAGI